MDARINHYLPHYQFKERHATIVNATVAEVRAAVMTCNLAHAPLVRFLFRLRGLPTANLTLAGLENVGFRILDQQTTHELVLGLVGRFWTYSGELQDFTPEQFTSRQSSDFARAAINFRWEALSDRHTRLSTETRIWCPTEASRRRFTVYWWLIRPFSGLVRIAWLRLIRRKAESRRSMAVP